MTETFYPITPTIPAVGVRVVVIWAGRQFAAARAVDKKAHTVRWVEECGGKLVWLNDEPDCWRPEKSELWKAPLPEPLATTMPRMADIRPHRNRYSAMSVQADQSARTQAEIREELGDAEEALEQLAGDHRWWLTQKPTYSKPGAISEREAEGRVAIAILVDGICGRFGAPSGITETSSALSGMVHETLTSADSDAYVRFDPSPRDNSDYPLAFAWFTALNPPELWWDSREPWSLSQAQCVLVWRVIGLSWRQIGRRIGRSHTGARKIYGAALSGVHRAANGKPVLKHVMVRDRMKALRERNRAFASR